MKVTTSADPILGRAMLVNVDIGVWEARKHDRDVTEKVNKRYGASADAGRWNKHLFGGKVESLSAVLNAAHAVRIMHYAQTLPWSDDGWRLLPTANYFNYTQELRKKIDEFWAVLEVFLKEYPRLLRTAKEKLNGMFRPEEYPATGAVRSKFHAEIEFAPVPASADFRVNLPAAELARMEQDVTNRVQEAVRLAMTDAWQRLGEVVYDLRERLVDGKYLRDTMVERIGAVAEALGRMNLTGDAHLEKVRKQALAELATLDVSSLRDDTKARTAAASKADEILKAMQGLYAPAKKEGK